MREESIGGNNLKIHSMLDTVELTRAAVNRWGLFSPYISKKGVASNGIMIQSSSEQTMKISIEYHRHTLTNVQTFFGVRNLLISRMALR